ncbi:MAG: MerR family DNA-binding transcriptional regulator [Caldilineaceae bacterium]|nr:MerR family DNA-binding transcriptional regulator [Caldilineaceae bacterium]
MMQASSNYLTLKQAAQQLGVHEQTLRSWERRGLSHLARLPQSGYRRVPVAEVQRLKAAMHTPSASVSVRLELPQRDDKALEQAESLAAQVRVELANCELAGTFDDFMQERRGRAWLP